MFKLAVSLIALALLFCAQPASAFVPDDEELAALLQKSYGPLASWEADVTFPGHYGVSVNVNFARGKWRQEWRAGDTAVGVGQAGSVIAACTADGFALSPLFVWMVPDPLTAWRSWGVDCAIRSYGFCGDAPCIMLGAEPGDDRTPAVHLDNEDMAPLLVRYAVDGKRISVAYSDYKTLGGYRVPQKVLLTVDGETLEMSVKWKSVMKADGEELYARDSVPPVPCAEPPAPFAFLRDNFRYPSIR
ncbi:hypothetical protein [Pseudodesulfovibrio portus]|uniref:Outer membrane lipoprotein-sorting protein n=1 Tax=Pseudodesulfovibrio portus TaxID=231439 RepID=A0ABM8ANZ9_9BACT|nr:hypothetical protein [Pseudodesulfovibrio portus]BDQ33105.1 hypothetical protein JCM14722_06470 [Pseudodesulfovibrio portus]